MTEFRDTIDKLTRHTSQFILRDDGIERATGDGLLQQLREAVFGGMETGGGGSAFGSKPPIDASALDLLNEITEQAAQALAAVDVRPTPFGHAETYVRLWSGMVSEGTVVHLTRKAATDAGGVFDERIMTTATDLATEWVSRIEGFFSPARTQAIPNDCPKCGVRHVSRIKDGHKVQEASLTIVKDRETGLVVQARCAACGASWARDEMFELAGLLGYPLPPEVIATP